MHIKDELFAKTCVIAIALYASKFPTEFIDHFGDRIYLHGIGLMERRFTIAFKNGELLHFMYDEEANTCVVRLVSKSGEEFPDVEYKFTNQPANTQVDLDNHNLGGWALELQVVITDFIKTSQDRGELWESLKEKLTKH